MADREKRLGRGLDMLMGASREKALSPEVVAAAGERVLAVPYARIRPNPYQPRAEFATGELDALVSSLRAHGLLQPIIVRRKADRFELVSGERRWRAAGELGWGEIQAVVVDATDRQMLEWAMVENLQRENLNAIEIAVAYQRMRSEFGMTQEEIAGSMGVSRPAVANAIRLLELPAAVRERVSRGTLAPGAARALLGLPSEAAQLAIAARVEKEGLSVRDVEKLVAKGGIPSASSPIKTDPNVQEVGRELQELLGMPVKMKGNATRGVIAIRYSSTRELNAALKKLRTALGGKDQQARA